MPAASHPITSPDRNHTPKRIASTTPYSQGPRFLDKHSRRRLGNPWVGPINAALKRLKLAPVTPGATSTLSASSASLFLCPVFGRLFLFLHPCGHEPTAPFMYCVIPGPRVKCTSAPVPRDAKLPKILCHAIRPFFLLPPPAPVFELSLSLPTWPSWVTCGHPCGAAVPTTTTSSCARLFRCSRIRFAGGRLCRRGHGCSALNCTVSLLNNSPASVQFC